MSARVALLTCAALPELDEDGPALRAALAELGVEGVPVVWGEDLRGFDAAVLRSTCDYVPGSAEFMAWAAGAATQTRLFNRIELLRANTDKRYLSTLERAGVPVVPTTFLAPGEALPDYPEYVVKPAVSAGCKDTARFGDAGEALALAELIRAKGGQPMVQPYVAAIDRGAETALMHFDGVFSHAIAKSAMLQLGRGVEEALYREEQIAPREASAAERAVARAALKALDAGDSLYARVDLVPGPAGPCVLEVELCEPSVFLGYAAGAADRFAAAIVGRVRPPGSA